MNRIADQVDDLADRGLGLRLTVRLLPGRHATQVVQACLHVEECGGMICGAGFDSGVVVMEAKKWLITYIV